MDNINGSIIARYSQTDKKTLYFGGKTDGIVYELFNIHFTTSTSSTSNTTISTSSTSSTSSSTSSTTRSTSSTSSTSITVSTTVTTTQLQDSYSESNTIGSGGGSFGGYDGDMFGQSFANTSAKEIKSFFFYLARVNNPTGNIYVSIYAHTGTYGTDGIPTGSALASSDVIDVSTLPTTGAGPQLKRFTFTGANQIVLGAATKYFAVLVCAGQSSGSNATAFYTDNSAPTHGGNFAVKYGASSWSPVSSVDGAFYEYTAP